jgi:anti-sigma regulatory factor (Ser/Thr protein kinase)
VPHEERWPLTTQLTLAAWPTAVACARLHAKQVVWEWGLAVLADTAELLVSELVTNAVTASQAVDLKRRPSTGLPDASCIGLRLTGDRHRVLIEVWDADSRPPVLAEPDLDAEGGRGLFLVEKLSERWGYYQPDEVPVPVPVSARDQSRQIAAAPVYPHSPGPPGKVVWCEVAVSLYSQPSGPLPGKSISEKGDLGCSPVQSSLSGRRLPVRRR